MIRCDDCGVQIPQIRLEVCPDTRWCVGCADNHTERLVGFIIYPHKTGGEVIITSDKENFRRFCSFNNIAQVIEDNMEEL